MLGWAADRKKNAVVFLNFKFYWLPRAVELLITGHRLSLEPRFAAGAGGSGAVLDVWVGCVMAHAVSREE